MENENLVKRLKENDRKEWCNFYNAHSQSIRGIGFNMGFLEEDVEDILQDTMFRAYRYMGSYASRGSIKAWVEIIAKSRYLNLARRRKVERAYDYLKAGLHREPGNYTERQIIARENIRIIEAELRPEVFKTLALRALGYDVYEVSEAIGRPIGTVCSRRKKQIDHLKKLDLYFLN